MAKKRKKKNQEPPREVTLQNKRFLNYLLKKHERLTIILDDNISKGVDPVEEDINFLLEEWRAFDNSNLAWAKHEDHPEQSVTQGELYAAIKS